MFSFKSTYAQLPSEFFEKVLPSSARHPKLIQFNEGLAQELGVDRGDCSDLELAEIFSGQKILTGSVPLAMAYAGHQFGHFVPRLGDGRAILLGEISTPDERLVDVQLKGSGPTSFSRGGDGLAALGPVMREYLVSEAMAALGIPTTRSLAMVLTGDEVFRDERLPGAVLTRVSASHLRVGTFEFFRQMERPILLKALADYAIHPHDPELFDLKNESDRYLSFFRAVAHRQLNLVAQWMGVGFIHGVMNTDNMTISGETIDFGPCAFMDRFEAAKVFSSIDRRGRYAYDQQGRIAIWNLGSLANTLLPLIGKGSDESVQQLEAELAQLSDFFDRSWLRVMGAKLGFFEPRESDREWIETFLRLLETNQLDFTNGFRSLSRSLRSSEIDPVGESFFLGWKARIQEQSQSEDEVIRLLDSSNPAVIPRNHQIEKAIEAANRGDFSLFHQIREACKSPFEDLPSASPWIVPPKAHEEVQATFCGT